MKFFNLLLPLVVAVEESAVTRDTFSETHSGDITIYNAKAKVKRDAVGSDLKNHNSCSSFNGNCHACVLAGCTPITQGKTHTTVECDPNNAHRDQETPTFGSLFG